MLELPLHLVYNVKYKYKYKQIKNKKALGATHRVCQCCQIQIQIQTFHERLVLELHLGLVSAVSSRRSIVTRVSQTIN